jgi:hypothetical protein
MKKAPFKFEAFFLWFIFVILKKSSIQAIFSGIKIVDNLGIITDLPKIFEKNHDLLNILYLMVEKDTVIISTDIKLIEIVNNFFLRFEKL